MRFRAYKNTDLTVSEVGFGLWTISTGWWGNFTEGEAIELMHKAYDLGVTLFDAADTYGNGLSEELIAKAFPNQRDKIVIATKVGYDFVHHGEARGRGQREISLLRHRAWACDWVVVRGNKLHSRARRHQRAAHLQHAGATSRVCLSPSRDRCAQRYNVSDSCDAFVRNARRKIHCGDHVSADRSSQPSSAQLAAQRD